MSELNNTQHIEKQVDDILAHIEATDEIVSQVRRILRVLESIGLVEKVTLKPHQVIVFRGNRDNFGVGRFDVRENGDLFSVGGYDLELTDPVALVADPADISFNRELMEEVCVQ